MREKRGRVFIHIAPCPPSHPSPNSPQKGSLGPFLSANILTRLRLFQCPFQNSIESKHGRDRGSPHALKGPVPVTNSSSPRMPTWPRSLLRCDTPASTALGLSRQGHAASLYFPAAGKMEKAKARHSRTPHVHEMGRWKPRKGVR